MTNIPFVHSAISEVPIERRRLPPPHDQWFCIDSLFWPLGQCPYSLGTFRALCWYYDIDGCDPADNPAARIFTADSLGLFGLFGHHRVEFLCRRGDPAGLAREIDDLRESIECGDFSAETISDAIDDCRATDWLGMPVSKRLRLLGESRLPRRLAWMPWHRVEPFDDDTGLAHALDG
jgi:hypothetical protein